HLNNLRYYSRYYFHGHSVGGTNPSLLEAMASNALIVAHGNVFNKSILGDQAVYFENSTDIEAVLKEDTAFCNKETFTKLNAKKIELFYTWDAINASYETYILNCIKERA
ncbi:MAG TPA: glycosyltransferase family 1 protein, partial [Aquaticitalea sp.]|nr:glycosyltransferase family 1 protein [Aquaticitalea sp.]